MVLMQDTPCSDVKWRGKWRMEWVASTRYTTSEHSVSSITAITTADAHASAASSRINWHPRRFKCIRLFRRKTKSGFCECAITLQTQSTTGKTNSKFLNSNVTEQFISKLFSLTMIHLYRNMSDIRHYIYRLTDIVLLVGKIKTEYFANSKSSGFTFKQHSVLIQAGYLPFWPNGHANVLSLMTFHYPEVGHNYLLQNSYLIGISNHVTYYIGAMHISIT